MSKLSNINKDIKKIDNLKKDMDNLRERKMKELELRIDLLELRNCLTCKKKKCEVRSKKEPTNNCENYYSKEFRYMLKVKEGIK